MIFDTVKCPACQDMGYIRCYSASAMRSALEVLANKRVHMSVSFADVPCTCEAGDKASYQTHQLLKKHYRSSEVKVPIRADDPRVIHVSKEARVDHQSVLREWATWYRGKQDELRAAREAPYQVFEDWNKQPF